MRELQNVVERAVIVSGAGPLRLELPVDWASSGGPASQRRSVAPTDVIGESEKLTRQRDNVRAALRQSHWKISGTVGAAEMLGVKPSTLASRIKKPGLSKVEPH